MTTKIETVQTSNVNGEWITPGMADLLKLYSVCKSLVHIDKGMKELEKNQQGIKSLLEDTNKVLNGTPEEKREVIERVEKEQEEFFTKYGDMIDNHNDDQYDDEFQNREE